MKTKNHNFTFFNEEWNVNNETDYNDNWTDSRPTRDKGNIVED